MLLILIPKMSLNCKNAKKMKSHIHCPVAGCLYSLGSERHFTEKKHLNQHIAKVHAEKKFSCAKCQKSFGLDWFRKHHEKTCGMEWKCECGIKYSARESLLTHARRTQHKLSDSVILSDKMKSNKASTKLAENPLIVVIQPIIQNLTCIKPAQTSLTTPRPILPKTTKPLFLTLSVPSNVASAPTQNNTSPVIPEQTNEKLPSSLQPCTPDVSALPAANQFFAHANSISDNTSASNHAKFQKSVATQTLENPNTHSTKLRQSQASQCTRRKPKSLKVGIESTHTQTAESAVVKIKKRRSRRKSVAITTEPSLLTDQRIDSQNSFWPGLKDFMMQNSETIGPRLYKNSTSTQTNMTNRNKILCDSETITDQELLKLSWDFAMKEKESTETGNNDFQMLADISSDDPMSALPVDMENNALPDLNLFSSSSLNGFSDPEIKGPEKQESHNQINADDKNASMKECSVFSVFGSCVKSDEDNKAPPPPTLSDIHTQTIASAVLDFNLLANMETQTTDDFTFSDLEFSDTETQTPWEDFPSIDSPLQTDQLSIEIQTDFPSFPSGLNLDPYELINSVDMQTMLPGCSSKETLGVNTETQTLDKFYFPELTNSEAQTLDMPDFMFDSLNS